ncbi:type II toxin-antitoxin system PemK/MazF family toxin [Chamaesiphon sp. OTE_75_metabat_556]|uniref:type II toxin-antitoxin system PemK/MazF family toxin n=1 Tax=Chamaesiphon sp. OTE_75_metabat_556 TaxID=2964692 RepID=UPI00286D6756|nr:type II toxin-antitoxin system PemK/MazF family toxin [Chamaesiphon sp. OTE_75_metabat_556]
MATSRNYRLGSIWLVNFDPSIGTEIRKTRPAMIISGTLFNQRRKVTVLPITSSSPDSRLLPVVVALEPDGINGLTTDSFIICIDPMTFDKQRLVKQLGMSNADQIRQVQTILRSYLELDIKNSDLEDSLDLFN